MLLTLDNTKKSECMHILRDALCRVLLGNKSCIVLGKGKYWFIWAYFYCILLLPNLWMVNLPGLELNFCVEGRVQSVAFISSRLHHKSHKNIVFEWL